MFGLRSGTTDWVAWEQRRPLPRSRRLGVRGHGARRFGGTRSGSQMPTSRRVLTWCRATGRQGSLLHGHHSPITQAPPSCPHHPHSHAGGRVQHVNFERTQLFLVQSSRTNINLTEFVCPKQSLGERIYILLVPNNKFP